MLFVNYNIQVVEKKKTILIYLKNIRTSTTSGENDKGKSKTCEQKKWNSYMNYYRNTRKASSKQNQNYACNNEKQSLTTKESENTESQKNKKEKYKTWLP